MRKNKTDDFPTRKTLPYKAWHGKQGNLSELSMCYAILLLVNDTFALILLHLLSCIKIWTFLHQLLILMYNCGCKQM